MPAPRRTCTPVWLEELNCVTLSTTEVQKCLTFEKTAELGNSIEGNRVQSQVKFKNISKLKTTTWSKFIYLISFTISVPIQVHWFSKFDYQYSKFFTFFVRIFIHQLTDVKKTSTK